METDAKHCTVSLRVASKGQAKLSEVLRTSRDQRDAGSMGECFAVVLSKETGGAVEDEAVEG